MSRNLASTGSTPSSLMRIDRSPMLDAMLGHPKTFIGWFAIGPVLLAMFAIGALLGLIAPSLGWLAGWLMLMPVLIVGGALVLGVVGNVIGHFLR
ncbi:MAG: hypothetical protein J0I72_00610 [Stenotrophomonas sp.]|nr:hypothetical protein [Xanthomonadales bacterium]MBN8767838.1 hypothetical protein [Stenotrophomonas sp.]